jgi:hypothetical protein
MDRREHDIIRVRSLPTSGRRPKTMAEERICQSPGCITLLNRYNQSQHCYAHRELRYPRIRGSAVSI